LVLTFVLLDGPSLLADFIVSKKIVCQVIELLIRREDVYFQLTIGSSPLLMIVVAIFIA